MAYHSITGIQVTFPNTKTYEILDMRIDGPKRGFYEITHAGQAAPAANHTGNRQYVLSDLQDAGEVEFDVLFENSGTPAKAPDMGASGTLSIKFPGYTAPGTYVWTATAGQLSYSVRSAGFDDAIKVTVRYKILSDWTHPSS